LLINGTVCQFVVLTPAVLTVLKVYVSRMEPKTLKLCMSVEIVEETHCPLPKNHPAIRASV